MNLILLFPEDFADKNVVRLKDYRADHLRKILRAYVGRKLKVGLANKGIGEGRIVRIEKGFVDLEVNIPNQEPALPLISLILALPRPQTLKKVLELTATMGIRSLHLINAERVEKSFFSSKLLKDRQWLKHVRLGLEQGGRTFLPEVRIHPSFPEFCRDTLRKFSETNSIRLIASPDSTASLWQTELAQDYPEKRIFGAIGPEGGWREEEINQFIKAGFQKISLGPSLLRVENAVCAFISQIELLHSRPSQ